MLRYLFTLARLLDSKSKVRKHYSPDTVISDLFDENLDEIAFIKSLAEFEIIYGFEIPQELFQTDLTLGELAGELSQLPEISADLFPEFYDIKFKAMVLTKRYIELEIKTDKKSILEKQKINKKFEELDDKLNNLL